MLTHDSRLGSGVDAAKLRENPDSQFFRFGFNSVSRTRDTCCSGRTTLEGFTQGRSTSSVGECPPAGILNGTWPLREAQPVHERHG